METNDGPDPFGSIVQLCYVSSSQERRLRRLRFVGDEEEPDELSLSTADSESSRLAADITVESTGVFMESLSESSEDRVKIGKINPRNILETPTEGSMSVDHHPEPEDRTVDGGPDRNGYGNRAIYLGRDPDIGVHNEPLLSQLEKFRDLKGEFASLNEKVKKRLKFSDLKATEACVQTELRVTSRERWVESIEKLKFKAASPQLKSPNSSEKSKTEERISGESENCEESRVTNRKLDSSTQALELESNAEEENDEEILNIVAASNEKNQNCTSKYEKPANLSTRSIDDDVILSNEENRNCLDKYVEVKNPITTSIVYINKSRYTVSSVKNLSDQNQLERKTQGTRVLPMSIQGQVDNGRDKLEAHRVKLLDVLKVLAMDRERDYQYLQHLSILDHAKWRGMTFP